MRDGIENMQITNIVDRKLSSHSNLRASAKCVATDQIRVVASHHLTSSEKKREVEHFHKEEIGGSPEYRATRGRADRSRARGHYRQPRADRSLRFRSSITQFYICFIA